MMKINKKDKINKIIKTSIITIFAISALSVFSCEIGMGAAVDTANPIVEITYPPKNAIVRESFVVAGNCDDDLSIEGVSVTIQNAATKDSYGPYTATLAEDKKSWAVSINQKNTNQYSLYDSYKKWELPDGSYILKAVSKDKAGNISQEASIPLDIDNTAPVLIVSKPLSVGTETAQKYGRTLNLAGDIAEAHSTAKLTLYYKRYNSTSSTFIDSQAKTLSVSGFNAMSSDSPLIIAKYYSLEEIADAAAEEKAKLTEYRNNYLTIYGNEADDSITEDRLYYCGFLLEDNAKVFQNPGDSGSGKGNETSIYYINSDDFNEKLSDENTFNLNAQKIMEIINGSINAYSPADISTITSLLSNNGNSASSTELSTVKSTKFNLNPANNPYWVLSGFDYNGAEQTFTQTVQAGGKLPVIINAGTDGVLIDSSSVSVKIYHLGIDASSAKNENDCITVIEKGSLTGDVSSINPDITVDNAKQLNGSAFYKANHYYEISVDGEDKNHTGIVANGYRYGFMLYSASKAPDVSCSSPADDTIYGTAIDTNGITIGGEIKIEADGLKDLADTKKTLWVSGFEVTDATSTNSEPIFIDYETSTPIITGSNKDYNFTIKISKKDTSSIIPETPGKYKYAITLSAQDNVDGVGTATLILYVDNKGPEIKIESISPLVKNEENKDCVNGRATVSGTVFDSGSSIENVTYEIKNLNTDGSIGTKVKDGTIVCNANGAWSLSIPTTDTTGDWANKFIDGNSYRFIITAKDVVGNPTTEFKDFKVDQSTDKPTVKLQNENLDISIKNVTGIIEKDSVGNIKQLKNMFKPGDKISTQIDDDDGIGQIKVLYRKANSTDENDYTDLASKNDITIKPYAYDFEVPANQGEYEIKIVIKDTVGSLPTSTTEEFFVIAVDEGAPVLSDVSFAEDKAYYSSSVSSSFTVNGKVSDGSGLCKITAEPTTSIIQPTAADLANGGVASWSDTISIANTSGTYSVTYSATDKYGYTAQKVLDYKIDNNKPKLDSINVNGNEVTVDNNVSTVWSNSKTLNVTVTASDEGGSQLSSVQLKKNDGEWSSLKKNYNENGLVKDWTVSVDYTDSTTLNGDKLYIRAKDNAGNISAEKEITLTIDSTKPSLDFVCYKTGILEASNNSTVYVNEEKLTIYGNYSDALSGVKALSFKIGGTTKTLSPKYYSVNINSTTNLTNLNPITSFTEGSTSVKAWSVEITKETLTGKLPVGKLEIIGKDVAGNEITEGSLILTRDAEATTINIAGITNSGNPYIQGTNYYLRNKKDGKIKISGTTTDTLAIDHTELVIEGNKNSERLPVTAAYTTTDSSWNFENIDLKDWESTEATVTITAYDKACNKTDNILKFIFDEKSPVIIHGAFKANYKFRGKDYYKYDLLRLGYANDWEDMGKYSQYSFGQETGTNFSLFVRQGTAKDSRENTDEEEISGVAKVKYFLISANNTLPSSIAYSITEIENAAKILAIGQNAVEGENLTETQKEQKIDEAEDIINTLYEKLKDDNNWSEFDINQKPQKYNLYGVGERQGIKADATITNFAMTTASTTNLLLLVPVDNCGNEGSPVVLSIHADNTEPEVNSESENTILTNGTSPFTLKGTVKDPAAGLQALTVKIGNTEIISTKDSESTTITNDKAKFTYKSYIDEAKTETCSLADAAAFAEWEVEITPDNNWFTYETEDSPVITLEAEDWAVHNDKGNINTQTIATITIDKKVPEVTPSYPVAGTELNGVNDVSGTVVENNTPESVALYITKKTDTFPSKIEDWGNPVKVITTEKAPAENPELNTSYETSTSDIYNYKFMNVDFYSSNLISSEVPEQDIYVLVLAKDKAGNTSVDKANITTSDVVACKIDRNSDRPVITITNTKNNSTYANSILYINITDDDGAVTSAQYSIDAGAQWNDIVNGKIENLSDGLKTIYFKVTDAKGKIFTSDIVSTAATPKVYSWDRVRIKDSTGSEITAAEDKPQVFTTIIDLERPDISLDGITRGKISEEGFTAISGTTEITQKLSEIILGGATSAIKVRMTASDTNGINSVKVQLFLNDSVEPVKEISAVKAANENEENTWYAIIPCDESGYDGVLKLRLLATDIAGREKNSDNYFTIDNTKPQIRVSNPSLESEQSGSISEEGTINEYVKLYYSVSPFEDSPDDLTALTNWKYKYYKPDNESEEKAGIPDNQISLKDICKYWPVSKNEDEMQMSFQIMFDGDTESSIGAHSDKLNTWLSKMGITRETAITNNTFENIVYLWLHIKAIDAAGNENENHHLIYWDPQGDRPKITMTYPVEPADSSKKAILGGNVTLMGTAMGTYPIAEVILKIDGVEKPVTLEGAGWTCPVKVTDLLGENEDSKDVTITVQAKDTETPPNISRTLSRIVTIDKTSPVVKQNLRLVQWKGNYTAVNGISSIDGDGNITFKTNAVERNLPYEDGINVSGKWYLVGCATDDTRVAKISYKKDSAAINEVTVENNTSVAEDGVYITEKTIGSGSSASNGVLFSFPVGEETDDSVGATKISMIVYDDSNPEPKYTDRDLEVYYDNKKPEIISAGDSRYKIDSSVFNSNGYYEFGSVATEAAVSGVNQTGVKRIAFYFKKDSNIISNVTGSSTSTSSLISSDGLWWKEVTASVSNTNITLNDADSDIHIGSLAKVNGAIYSVTAVDGTSVTIDGVPGNANEIKVYFARASVVNGNADDNKTLLKQSLITQGTTYIWSAQIDSKKIPDGKAYLNYVVYDGAGNYKEEQVECIIQNRAPRIAGIKLGTDDDGNGEVDTYEMKDSYHNAFANGYKTSSSNKQIRAVNVTFPDTATEENPSAALKVKRKKKIVPEIIGGHGAISYTYKIAMRDGNGWETDPYYTYSDSKILGTAAEQEDKPINKTQDIELEVADMVSTGIQPGNNQKFIFEISDSTEGCPLVATMNVIMDVLLIDTTKPQNTIIPFYWKSLKDNSLYASEEAADWRGLKGHIELPVDFGEGENPKVSGKIKIEGIAKDEVLLNSLAVTVKLNDTKTNTYSFAEYDKTKVTENEVETYTYAKTGFLKTLEVTTPGFISAEIKQATFGEYKEAGYITQLPKDEYGEFVSSTAKVPYFSQEYGHVVHWVLNLDTENFDTAIKAKTGVSLAANAVDRGKPNTSGAYPENERNAISDNITMDIVPYILGIKSKLSENAAIGEDSSEYDRTALGHYPMASTEKAYFYGFNLEAGATVKDEAGTTTTLGAANTTTYTGFTVYPTSDTLANFTSGKVSVVVDGVESLNNNNNNDSKGAYTPEIEEDAYTTNNNSYNRKPNTVNNYILTDDVVIDVWEFNDRAAKPYAKGVTSDPIMKINPANGIIGFAYQSGTKVFSMSNGTDYSYHGWVGDYDNLRSTGFTYDSAGNSYGFVLGGDINGSYSVSKGIVVSSLWQGQNTGYGGALKNATGRRIEEIGQVGKKGQTNASYNTTADRLIDKTRVLSPSLAVSGAGDTGTLYIAYYDHLNQEIRFRWGNSTKSYINDNYKGNGAEQLDGTAMNSHKYYVKDFQIIAENANEAGSLTETNTLGKPGPYVDIAVIAGNTNNLDVVVMVWYDSTNDCLKYTYNKIPLNSTTVNGTNVKFEGSDDTKKFWNPAKTIFKNAGQYCKIAVDADGGIHIAGYDSILGDVRYAYLSGYSADYEEENDSCIVDANGIVGSNLTLDVAKDKAIADGGTGKVIPYIGYYGSTGPKMAFMNVAKILSDEVSTTAGKSSTVNDMFTGYWEVTEVPTPSNAPKDRINVGVFKNKTTGVLEAPTNGGTASSHQGNNATSQYGTTYGNSTTNPVLGYQIRPSSAEGYIETAQMR